MFNFNFWFGFILCAILVASVYGLIYTPVFTVIGLLTLVSVLALVIYAMSKFTVE